MSEHICKADAKNLAILKPYLREEIVRCRDCKRWESGCCDWNPYYDDPVDDKPDGFCAWGERRAE